MMYSEASTFIVSEPFGGTTMTFIDSSVNTVLYLQEITTKMDTNVMLCGCRFKEQWKIWKIYPQIMPNAIMFIYSGYECVTFAKLSDIKKIDIIEKDKKMFIFAKCNDVSTQYELGPHARFMIRNYQ